MQLVSVGGLAGLSRALANGNKPLPNGIRSPRGEVRVNGTPARVGQPLLQAAPIYTGPGTSMPYALQTNPSLITN